MAAPYLLDILVWPIDRAEPLPPVSVPMDPQNPNGMAGMMQWP